MLEIILLFLVGKHIARVARSKNRNPVGYVVLMVFAWYGGMIAGAILGAVIAEASNANDDDTMIYIIPLALVGAASGMGVSLLIVKAVSPLKRSRDEYDDYEDYDDDRQPRRRHREDDDFDRPRSRRREENDDYDHDPPPRRRRYDDDRD